MKKSIKIEEYDYTLPDDKIAANPLPQRDSSKLLVYSEANVSESFYYSADEFIPEQSLIVFNNTRVIKARIFFDTGDRRMVEVFCLEPIDEDDVEKALLQKSPVKWNCLVGNFKKRMWKHELVKTIETAQLSFELKALVLEKNENSFIVEFNWDADISFGEVLQYAGNIPLPPYIKRESNKQDEQRYQTVYAEHSGSVAAPTAGLHFTENIFNKLRSKHVNIEYVTLNVGAGTFMPVKTDDALQHNMHAELIEVSKPLIKKLEAGNYEKLVAVGTTSLRTLESLFWLGAKLSCDVNDSNDVDDNSKSNDSKLFLDQWESYDEKLQNITVQQSMQALLAKLNKEKTDKIIASTRLMIVPDYHFKIADGLITNFHQPKSTLLLLIAAFVGDDWKRIYDYALQHNFRFLSYGDGCLLWKKS